MRVFAIRPQPGLAATIEAGRALGLDIHGYPLADVMPVELGCPPGDAFDGLLLGSANAVRHGDAIIGRMRDRPAFAVGEVTAEAARAVGLSVARTGSGGLQSLVDEIAARGEASTLLRLAGEKHTAPTIPAALNVTTRIVYRVAYQALGDDFAHDLKEGAVVLLHSGEAARHFAAECDRRGLDKSRLAIVALAPRIAEAAGRGWSAVAIAREPVDSALLALARDMCH